MSKLLNFKQLKHMKQYEFKVATDTTCNTLISKLLDPYNIKYSYIRIYIDEHEISNRDIEIKYYMSCTNKCKVIVINNDV
jgi:hypothetical protein